MLREDDREERFLQRIGLALEHAEGVAPAIRIMRREGDEAAFGQSRGVRLIGAIAARFRIVVDRVQRHAFKPVLADDDRTALAQLEVFRNQQNAPGKNIGPDVEGDFVAGPLRLV